MDRDPEPKTDKRRARSDRRTNPYPAYSGEERRKGDRRSHNA